MPTTRRSNFKADWKKYFFELLVIITGITISFMVQNWREGQEHKRLEVQTLERIQTDLVADSVAMHNEMELLGLVFRGAAKIVSAQSLEDVRDSLNIFLGVQMNYTVFGKTDIGYQGIKQAGRSDLISNKALLDMIVKQYAVNYKEVDEWGEIDQSLIIDQFIPYFNERFPFIPGFNFVEHLDRVGPIIRSDSFRNMVRSNAQVKFQVIDVYKRNLVNVRELLMAIEEELKRLK